MALLDTLLAANNLKTTPRMGWVLRGVPEAESVAEHSYGVAFVALVLAEAALASGESDGFDRGKLLSMALLHDLAESVIGDLPLPAQRFFPAGVKGTAERAALVELLAGLPDSRRLLDIWAEYEEGSGPEARVVHDADRLDMLLQALVYMERTGNRALAEFWDSPAAHAPFEFSVSQGVYAALRDRYNHRIA